MRYICRCACKAANIAHGLLAHHSSRVLLGLMDGLQAKQLLSVMQMRPSVQASYYSLKGQGLPIKTGQVSMGCCP
jgi:hypothetical protein